MGIAKGAKLREAGPGFVSVRLSRSGLEKVVRLPLGFEVDISSWKVVPVRSKWFFAKRQALFRLTKLFLPVPSHARSSHSGLQTTQSFADGLLAGMVDKTMTGQVVILGGAVLDLHVSHLSCFRPCT